MNADGLLNRVLVETTGDKQAAEALITEFWIALVSDWRARTDFYTEIAQINPDTAQLWALMVPTFDEWLAGLRANGYHESNAVDLSDPATAFHLDHPDALNPLLLDFPNPLTDEELNAAGRVLWGNSDAHN